MSGRILGILGHVTDMGFAEPCIAFTAYDVFVSPFLGNREAGFRIGDSRYIPNLPIPLPMVIECGHVRVYVPDKHPQIELTTFSWSKLPAYIYITLLCL